MWTPLRHSDHGGVWNCPVDAVDHFLALGWERLDEAPESPSDEEDPEPLTGPHDAATSPSDKEN